MHSQEVAVYSTGEAAEHLQVSTRTIRTWIDQFSDYIQPNCNERGHYLLNHGSLDRLRDIQRRLQEPKKKMKQVREDLYQEKLLRQHVPEDQSDTANNIAYLENDQTSHHVITTINGVGSMMEEVVERMDHLEDNLYAIYESVEKIDRHLHSLAYEILPANEIRQQFEEIRKKQDQLKVELRNINFSQRLTTSSDQHAADKKKTESSFVPRRQKKSRFFNLF